MPDVGQRRRGRDERPGALIVTGHTDVPHDWRTISREPMVREMYDERASAVTTPPPATERL